MDSWYLSEDGSTKEGPLSAAAVADAITSRRLDARALVWREGMSEWTPLAGVPEFATLCAPASPSSPPIQPGPIGRGGGTQPANYASFGARFAAHLIDGFMVTIIAFCVFAAAGGVIEELLGGSRGGANEDLQSAVGCSAFVLIFVAEWLYRAGLESSKHQATVGKMVLKLRVTDLDGQRVSFARATGRYCTRLVSCLLFGLGFLIAAFTERRQALHDFAAGTLVLKG